MTNAIGINILDTAQLNPDYVLNLIDRLDMGAVTVFEATHPDKAWALAKAIQARRGDKTDIFYRRWRNNLPDERMVAQTTPEEFVRYMKDVMEAGFIAAVYNEAQQSPMTPLTRYSVEVVERTAGKGWKTVHFKTATGTPIGYRGERPSGYAESDDLWLKAAEVNKPLIDQGQKPLVYIAPHAYFAANWRHIGGHTDRPQEIIQRLTAHGIDPRYLPIHIGETGLQQMDTGGHIRDAEAGWRSFGIDDVTHAQIVGQVIKEAFMPFGGVSHLYAVGDQQTANGKPGQWGQFNLMGVTAFWDELERLSKDGRFQIVVNPTTKPIEQFVPKPQDAKWPHEWQAKEQRNIRSGPAIEYREGRALLKGDTFTMYDSPTVQELAADGQVYNWKWVESERGSGWCRVTGWGILRITPPTVEVPIVKDPPAVEIPTPPPAEIVLTLTRTELDALITAKVQDLLHAAAYEAVSKAYQGILRGQLAALG